jgi:hypothetical protein
MDSDLAIYVVAHYAYLMTPQERLALRHLGGTIKATQGLSDMAAQGEAKAHKVFSNLLSDDPLVLELARGGYQRFAEQTAQRILSEGGNQVFLNLCPQCARLARTPTARQCRFCGHDWHETATPQHSSE